MIKAVLFDIDGTLVNSLEYYLNAYRKILKVYGFEFKDEKIVKTCFGKTEEAICQTLRIPEKAEEFRNRYANLVKENFPNLQLFSGAIETLEFLQNKQIKLGLITFAHRWYAEKISQKFNLEKYTHIQISFDDVENPKPNSEAVDKACTKLGVKNTETLIVGDSKSDILMGKNAQSQTALFTPKENLKFYNFEEMAKETNPDFIITTLKKIEDLIV